jgi:hypothetical protein
LTSLCFLQIFFRDFGDPNLLSREEFEARKAELKRRREREQRFGRTEADVGPPRLQGVRVFRVLLRIERNNGVLQRQKMTALRNLALYVQIFADGDVGLS